MLPKIHAAIFVTFIVYSEDKGLHHNSSQSTVTYSEDHELETVRAVLGKSQLDDFLERTGVKLKDIKYVTTTILHKNILDSYLSHLAGIN